MFFLHEKLDIEEWNEYLEKVNFVNGHFNWSIGRFIKLSHSVQKSIRK